MGLTEFTKFGDLPAELRLMIWNMAIRPANEPAAHVFTVFNTESEEEQQANALQSLIPGSSQCGLAAPRSSSGISSWRDGNPSAYMVDAGLWTACHESRYEMERTYKQSEWRSSQNVYDSPCTSIIRAGGPTDKEEMHITVRPTTDLFILRPFRGETIDWANLGSKIPFFRRLIEANFEAEHIALEYDPSWMEGAPEPREEEETSEGSEETTTTGSDFLQRSKGMFNCAARACSDQVPWAMEMWFVDKSFSRSDLSDKAKQDGFKWRQQFRGNGCTYVEMYSSDVKTKYEGSIWDFVDELETGLEEHFDKVYASNTQEHPSGRNLPVAPQVHVLACLVDGQ
ncbi:hypothetical protein QBC35DRAFT_509100 [Podospora australis]|uniref:2EXR domain-containing protein n=1 Tax=Podospora australis TaxID=1536484 RepID=A0AAN7ADU2_9PEZI|nr:hypothetical protein QBC35DRAFT_509100 [Podospora australis]